MKNSAHSKYVQYEQKGIVDPKIIIGGIVVLIVIFFLATGSFKFSASVKDSKNSISSTEENTPTEESTTAEQSTPKPTSIPKTYQNEKNGFSLEYPAEWSLKENPTSGYVAGIIAPKESSSDTYQENLLIKAISTASQPNITLQELTDSWEKQTTSAESSLVIVDRADVNLGGEQAKSFTYTFTSQSDSGKGIAQITLKNNKAYVFQFNALEKDFDKTLDTVQTILSSVKF